METVLLGMVGICVLAVIYSFYQMARNDKVFNIRRKWILESDERWLKYSYSTMFEPKQENWYGLKFPNEKDFQ